jgi:AcrR family transcriptional regulator
MIVSTARPAADRQGTSPPQRERILVAARELFYRRGIHAVGVDTIAEAAGTNKMTLYRHFASKDLLVAACLSELTQEFDAAWDADRRRPCRQSGRPAPGLAAPFSDFKENEVSRAGHRVAARHHELRRCCNHAI